MKLSNDHLINMAKFVFGLAWTRCKKLKCIPLYARTAKHKSEILKIYVLAQLKSTSRQRFQVDHILPLNNSLVCGLHVATNLQIITQKKNSVKGNIFICYVQHGGDKSSEIEMLNDFKSGSEYIKQVKVRKRRRVKPKTKQKLAKKTLKNSVKRVLTSKKVLKTVKNSVIKAKKG